MVVVGDQDQEVVGAAADSVAAVVVLEAVASVGVVISAGVVPVAVGNFVRYTLVCRQHAEDPISQKLFGRLLKEVDRKASRRQTEVYRT